MINVPFRLPNLADRLPFWFLVILVVSAPFEPAEPLISLPGQKLSHVELILFLSLFAWGLQLLIARRLAPLGSPLALPGGLLVTVMLLSTLTVAVDESTALRASGRVGAGLLLYLLVIDTVRSQRRGRALLAASASVGALVGFIGILEFLELPLIWQWLQHFRPGPAYVAGMLRITSTLQYPTITSMYLEISFGAALGLFVGFFRSQGVWKWPAFLAVLLTGTGAILTLTRSGWIVLAAILVSCGALLFYKRGVRETLGTVGLVTAGLATAFGLLLSIEPDLSLRLSPRSHPGWFQVEIGAPQQLRLHPKELRKVTVTVTNTGQADWLSDGSHPFHVSYHWMSANGTKIIEYEGLRTPLPPIVRTGDSVPVQAQIAAPSKPGDYRLVWDIVRQDRFWFSEDSPVAALTRATVAGSPAGESVKPSGGEAAGSSGSLLSPKQFVGRRQLWRAGLKMLSESPWLGVGPAQFRLLYGPYAGLEGDDWDRRHHTNNLYLQFFVTCGILGGLLFLWMAARLTRSMFLYLSHPFPEPLNLGISLAVFAILLHGLFDFFLEFTPTYVATWVVFGLLHADFEQKGAQTRGQGGA